MSSKISQSKQELKNISRGFTSARNVVNGYLKKEREQRVSKELGSSGSRKLMRKMSNKELI
jgi:hypothetical protein